MGIDLNAAGVGQSADAGHFGEAAAMHDIGLDDIVGATGEIGFEFVAGAQILSAGNGHRQRGFDLEIRL